MAVDLAHVDLDATLTEEARGYWVVIGFADVGGLTKPVEVTALDRESIALQIAEDKRLSPKHVAIGVFRAEQSSWGGSLVRLTPVCAFGRLPYAWLYPPPGLLELLLGLPSDQS